MGSSPLTRGKRLSLRSHMRLNGLIPAHAGKTKITDAFTAAPPAHPRSRGENVELCVEAEKKAGSSPLTRGKLDNLTIGEVITRLIPAHAGKTSLSSAAAVMIAAHPRSRGENAVLDQAS